LSNRDSVIFGSCATRLPTRILVFAKKSILKLVPHAAVAQTRRLSGHVGSGVEQQPTSLSIVDANTETVMVAPYKICEPSCEISSMVFDTN
jgi:hypothetical protein